MRKPLVIVVIAAVALVAFAAGLSGAAGARSYQFTGEVKEVDAKAKTVSVDKGGDVWEFSTATLKEFKVKKGDKVTVHYEMVVRKVEVK
jgi:Cu/Ag efflux protein CusF